MEDELKKLNREISEMKQFIIAIAQINKDILLEIKQFRRDIKLRA